MSENELVNLLREEWQNTNAARVRCEKRNDSEGADWFAEDADILLQRLLMARLHLTEEVQL